MHITVISEEGEVVQAEVDASERLSIIVSRLFPRLGSLVDTDLGLFNAATLDELDFEQTVSDAGLADGDEIILEMPAGFAGFFPADLMSWLSGLVDQAHEIPIETLFKYLDWVVTSVGAVELIRRGAGVVRRVRNRGSKQLEDLIRQVKNKSAWRVADLADQTGIKTEEAKGLLRLLGFEYNRRTRRYESSGE